MYPAREVLRHAALRSNSGPLDPMEVAKEIGVSAADALAWVAVAHFPVPAVLSEDGRIAVKPSGLLTILTVGAPCRGIMFCFDRTDGSRECVRMRPDGVRFAIVEGVRKNPEFPSGVAVRYVIGDLVTMVDRVREQSGPDGGAQ